MNISALLLPSLYAMRVLLEGVIGTLEGAIGAPPPMEDGECPHPPERQVNATVMGGTPQVLCLVCGRQRMGTAPAQ